MIESLLRADGLRTGRFTSPHLMSITERITLDGEPISDERFDEVWREIAPYVALVDERKIDGVSMTFFEIVTAMAYAAFADAPVGVAVVEVGLGGAWDATNVADAEVAVVTPIDLDHTHLLGSTIGEITREKAGIIKPGAHAILAGQSIEAAEILLARCAEVGALPQREGVDFGVIDRQLAVAGQLIRLSAADGPVDDVFLPLYGAHQAANAAQALAAVEAFLGLKALHADVVREGFAKVHFPGRLELVRRSPGVVLDAAHNPHGARAAAAGITEAFAFAPLIGVIAVMGDKDARGILEVFEEIMNHVVVTQVASTSRGMPAEVLGEMAKEVFGASRVTVVPRLDDAIDQAVALAEVDVVGSPGVLITGSVVAVGEARTLLVKEEPMVHPGLSEDLDNVWDADYSEDGDFSEDGHEAGRDWR
jgi:dihydrofolate synthase/folylpolyglutamate synthase